MKKVKTPKQMERHLKGMANHYRIEILLADNASMVTTLIGLTIGVFITRPAFADMLKIMDQKN